MTQQAICLIPNCGKSAPASEAFCSVHSFPKPKRNVGGAPCGECHLRSGETCDICGAKEPNL